MGWEMGNIFGMYTWYSPALVDPYWEKLPEVLSTILGRRPRKVLRPRAQFLPIRIDQGRWITFLFLSYWHLKVSGKFYFSLQPMYVQVERVRVDEARDRLQTKHTTWFLACNLYYHNSALSSFQNKERFLCLGRQFINWMSNKDKRIDEIDIESHRKKKQQRFSWAK